MMSKINIADDFSSKPFGRYKADGKFSGERFRKENLLPAFHSGNDKIEVYLDDVKRGFGSSFLEESFGGLIREHIQYRAIKDRLVIITNDEDYEEEIWEYIEEEKDRSA
jgi:hypothetical protein